MTTASTPLRFLAILLCACVLALPACDSDDSSEDAGPQTITYRVTGDGSPAVVYSDDSGSINSVSSADLPFTQEVDGFETGSSATVSASLGEEGTIVVQILDDSGNVLDEATGSGIGASATASYQFGFE